MSEKTEKFLGIVTLVYLIFVTLAYVFITVLSDVSIYHAFVSGIAVVLVWIIATMRGWLK